MNTVVKTKIVRIGNSRGILLPKGLLDQVDFDEEVTLEVQQGNILIRSLASPRSGWEEQFQLMAERQDDILLDRDEFISTEWDEEEWNW